LVDCRVLCGDALTILATLPDESFDGVITDPPYASGGLYTTQRVQSTAVKYTDNKSRNPLPDFDGDSKDMYSYLTWCRVWLVECKRVLKKGGVICVFTDDRQIDVIKHALQHADLTYRGIVVWDKTECARPQLGRFTKQCEYVIWGSKGDLPFDRKISPSTLKGIFRVATLQKDKVHQTQKPVELMRELCRVVEIGGTILDPFCGSGSTLVAAKQLGYNCVGIESCKAIAKTAQTRIDAVNAQTLLTHIPPQEPGKGGLLSFNSEEVTP